MTDLTSSAAIHASDLPADKAALFYVVSRRKFTLLFLSTLGLYHVYWFYKNWDGIRDGLPYATDFRNRIWPLPRAVFAVFFVHALFRKIKEYGADSVQLRAWGNASHATWIVLLLLLMNAMDRLAGKGIGSPWTDIVSVLLLVPMLSAFLAAQNMINIACDDPQGQTNAALTWANYAWIVCGVLFWILILFGMFAAAPGAGGDAGFHSGGDGGF